MLNAVLMPETAIMTDRAARPIVETTVTNWDIASAALVPISVQPSAEAGRAVNTKTEAAAALAFQVFKIDMLFPFKIKDLPFSQANGQPKKFTLQTFHEVS